MKIENSIKRLFPEIYFEKDVTIEGLSLDSNAIQINEAFVALQGRNYHGSQFISGAIDNGANCVLSDQKIFDSYSVPVFVIPGLRARLAEVSAKFYKYPSRELKLVGVTGTNGKSTIVYLLSYILSKLGEQTSQIGTLGLGAWNDLATNNLTTPDIIQLQKTLYKLLRSGNTTVTMEVSSIGIEEGRIDGVDFDTAIFTNLSSEHLDYHKNMRAYANAKKKLFKDFILNKAILNVDDPVGMEIRSIIPKSTDVITYGKENADFCLNSIIPTPNGMELNINTPYGKHNIITNLIGNFNAYNILAMLSYASSCGFKIEEILKLLQSLPVTPGRMQELKSDSGLKVFIDYSHTPDSIRKALSALRPYTIGKLICVFGCGGERDRDKRAKMGKISSELSDFVYLTDDNPRAEEPKDIINDILSGVVDKNKTKIIHDRAHAIEEAICKASPDDIILIAGKGHETQQIYRNKKLPFNDLDVAIGILNKL